MGTTDDRVDAYIDRAADFARPILRHLRELLHAACPDVEETMRWSEAKSEDTRKKRLGPAIAWMAEGKPRFWKYMR